MTMTTAPSTVPWSSIRALTLDIYGTLIDWDSGLIAAARNTSLAPHFSHISDAELLQTLEAHCARLERERPTMRKEEINSEALRVLVVQDLGLIKQGKVSAEEVDEQARGFGGKIGGFEAFGDTVDAINRLSTHYRLIPLTNMDHASYARTLSGPLAGCAQAFTTSYLAEDIGSYKPSLGNFAYLLDHLKADYGIEKEQVCHVAQSLFHDHGATREVGLRSLWVDRYGVLQGMMNEGRGWEDVKEEFGMEGRVRGLGELADLVEGALK